MLRSKSAQTLARWSACFGLLIILLFVGSSCLRPDSREKDMEASNQMLTKRVADLEQKLQQVQAENEEQLITLYFVKNTPTSFLLVPEVRRAERQPDPLKTALEELIRGPADPALSGLVPKTTKVLGVTVRNYVAYPDFSNDITRMSVGSSAEALVIASIANTLIKFPGVEKVQILVEGKTVESLAGHIDLSKPVGRNEKFLSLE